LAEEIRLNAAGGCACEPVRLSTAPNFEICPVAPAAPVQGEVFALAPDGAIMSLNQGYLVHVDPTGIISTSNFKPALTGVIAAHFLDDGTGVLASKGDMPNEPGDWTLRFPGGTLSAQDSPRLVPRRLARMPGADLYVLGLEENTFEVSFPGIEACNLDEPRDLRCTRQPLVYEARCNLDDDHFEAYASADNGVAFAATVDGLVFLRPPGDDRWFCDSTTGRLRFADGTRTLEQTSMKLLAALDDRLFGCARFGIVGSDREIYAVFSGAIPSLTATAAEALTSYGFDFRLEAEVLGECGSFSREGDTLLLTNQNRAEAYRFVRTGALVQSYDAIGTGGANVLFAGAIPERVERLIGDDAAMMAVAPGGSIYRRYGTGAFEPVYAPSPPDVRRHRALAASPSGGYAFSGSEAIEVRIGASCMDSTATGFTIEGLAQPGEEAVAAVPLTSRPGVFVVSFRHPQYTAFRFVDVESRTVEHEHSAPELADLAFFGGAELSPGRVIMLGEERIVELAEDLTEIAVEFDDPATPEIESSPTPVRWQAIDAVNGTAWIAGRHALARITARETPIAEAYWLGRLSRAEFQAVARAEPPTFYALDARCPDDVVLGATEEVLATTLSEPRSQITVWQLAHCAEESLELCAFDGYDTSMRTAPDNEAIAIGVLPAEGAPLFVFDDGIVQRFGAQRTALPFRGVARAVGGPRGVVVGGSGGRIAVIRDL
jgi:hypothetical protein